MSEIEIRHFHLFCGLGGGAKGFNKGQARVGSLEARFRCIGGIDVDAAAGADFARLSGATFTRLDLFDRSQYRDFHDAEPPADWREATPQDIQRAAGGERPHIVFLSAPCKGFSGLLSQSRSGTAKYQALNRLTLRGVLLMLEAWADDPPELVIFENVPRIASRGRPLLDRIGALLRHYGYAVAETAHDCGEIGGLAQSRKRFLLVARHREKVPPFLYEPPKHRLRGVGEILEKLPLPGDVDRAGPMHRVPSLQWKTWVRLAFVAAGSDWRSLNRLRVEGGVLADYGILPEAGYHGGVLGVLPWADPAPLISGRGTPTTGRYAVADPRVDGHPKSVQLGVRPWDRPAGVVTGKMFAGGGPNAVADPRVSGERYNTLYRIVPWADASQAVTGAHGSDAVVADPRPSERFDYKQNKYRVTRFDEASGAVIAASSTGNGAYCVSDPRPENWERRGQLGLGQWDQAAPTITSQRAPGQGRFSVADPRPFGGTEERAHYRSGGHYGVIPWEEPSGGVTAAGQHDNGRWSVADPRLPDATERGVYVIRALDDTWHRPFTTLELAALQSLVDPEEHLELEGLSDTAWRERIGNAVPPDAAQAIAGVMGRTLLLAWSGETFLLSEDPIWVRPFTTALAVDDGLREAP